MKKKAEKRKNNWFFSRTAGLPDSPSFFPPSGKASATSRHGSVLGSVTGCEKVYLELSSCPWVSYSWLWKIRADRWTLRSFSARWFGCKIFPHWWLLSRFLISWDRLESLPWATRTISEVCFQPLYLLCLPFSSFCSSFKLQLPSGDPSSLTQSGNWILFSPVWKWLMTIWKSIPLQEMCDWEATGMTGVISKWADRRVDWMWT